MSTISFNKYSGAGNDFILIDNRDLSFPIENCKKLCDRKFGIGADGLILLCPNLHMRIFNQDGSEAKGCGNGLRCLTAFIQELGIYQNEYQIKIGTQVVKAFFKEGFPVIETELPEEIQLHIAIQEGISHHIDSGAPHIVQFVSDVDTIDLPKKGLFLRQQFDSNATFVSLLPNNSLKVRTFEKGVEGETLSCGTAALAAAHLAQKLFNLQGIISIHFPGGLLKVWKENGRLFLTGPVEKVFTGSFELTWASK